MVALDCTDNSIQRVEVCKNSTLAKQPFALFPRHRLALWLRLWGGALNGGINVCLRRPTEIRELPVSIKLDKPETELPTVWRVSVVCAKGGYKCVFS